MSKIFCRGLRVNNVMNETMLLLGGITIVGVFSTYLPSAHSTFPKQISQFSEMYLATPVISLRQLLIKKLPFAYTTFEYGFKSKVNWTEIVAGSALEEVIFRWLIQSIALTEIPKQILKNIKPQYENLLDHKIIQIARVVLTATSFALLHIVRYGACPGMLMSHFFAGIYFSYLREKKTSIAELSTVHVLFNAIVIISNGGMRPLSRS